MTEQFRFNLQFSSEREDELMVGRLLKSLKNHKTAFIIRAVQEYIRNHPGEYDVSLLRKNEPVVDEKMIASLVNKEIQKQIELGNLITKEVESFVTLTPTEKSKPAPTEISIESNDEPVDDFANLMMSSVENLF